MIKLLTKAEVAAALGVNIHTFNKNIVALRRDQGFPSPVPGMGSRYDPIAIEAWRKRLAGILPARPTHEDDFVEEDIARWQEELDRRSRDLG